MRTVIYYIPTLCLCCALASAGAQVNNSFQSYNIKGSLQSVLPVANKSELKLYKELFKPRLAITGLSVEASSLYNRSLVSNDYYTTSNLFQYNVRNVLGIEVSGIPIKAEYIRRESTPAFVDITRKDWYKISFDVEKYKDKWKQLAEKLGPESLTKFGGQVKELKKNFTDKLIATYKDKARGQLQHSFDSIAGNIDPLELEGKSPQEIGTMLFGQDIDGLLSNAKQKLEQVKASELEAVEKDSTVASLKEKIEMLESKSRYIKNLVALVKAAKSSGMLSALKDLNGKAKEEYDKLMSNPEELAKRLAAKYNIGGIEKIFTVLSQFRAGGQSVPFAENANIPFLSKGISFEIKLKDKFIGFSTGRLIPVFNNLQFPATAVSPTEQVPVDRPFYWFVNYRKGYEHSNHKGIKLTSISNTGSSGNSLQNTDFKKKNTLLINLYSREKIFGNNWLNAEISKSIVKSPYEYTINPLTGERANKKPDLLTLDNISLKLKAEGSFEKAGINHQLYFNKLLGAYSNITENYLASGGYEAGFSVRMKPKGKKISSYLKGTIRNFNTPGAADSKWNTTDLRARFSYKLKKGQFVQLSTVWHDGYKSYLLNDALQVIRQQSRGVTADVNLVNKRIFGLYNTSYISAGFQKDIFPVTGMNSKDRIISNSYNILLNQSFLYGDHLLMLNVMYTNVSQNVDTLLYNTRLDADAGGTFRLSKKITAGLSAVYGYFKGAYTNVGIKTTVSATLFNKLQVDLYGDLRKNIVLINPLFDQFINVSCDLKYTIK